MGSAGKETTDVAIAGGTDPSTSAPLDINMDGIPDHLQGGGMAHHPVGGMPVDRNMDGILMRQDTSEAIRKYMYDKLAIGDDPEQAPELDGQNGASMATLLCKAIEMPMITALVHENALKATDFPIENAKGFRVDPPPKPHSTERCILLVRTHRSRWRAPERLKFAGRSFTLQSCLIGSEHCGHQTAVARSTCDHTNDDQNNVWAYSDSDAIRLGIHPILFRKPPNMPWHSCVSAAIPHSNANASSNFCDFVRLKGMLQPDHLLLRLDGNIMVKLPV